jgi:integrase
MPLRIDGRRCPGSARGHPRPPGNRCDAGHRTHPSDRACLHLMCTPMPLGRFLEEVWLPTIEPTVRPTTFVNYRSHVVHQIRSRLGDLALSELDGQTLNLFYARLRADGRVDGKGGLSPASVRRVHATLHRALRDAVRWGHLAENPADRCDPPRIRADGFVEMKTWDAEGLRSFLEFVRDDRLYPLWLLLAMTGMRRGEALGLRWSDVDLERAQLSVRQTLVPVGARIVISQPKTARGRRVVALDSVTIAGLRKLRAESPSSGDLIFVEDDGRPLNPSGVSRHFRRLVSGSGLPKIRLHDLRHTHATLALQAGVHPKIVSERLGHATVSLTLDVYSHAIGHMQADAAQEIANLVLG